MPDLASLGPPRFESPACCGSARLAVARRLHGHDGIRTEGRRSCSLASLAVRAASSRVRTHLRSLFARRVRSSQNSGHDGIRTHGHRMSSRDADATRIEVRRSVRTELRALEFLFYSDPKRRCGAGLPPERRLPNGRRTGTMGVSEPQVRERRKTLRSRSPGNPLPGGTGRCGKISFR